MMDSHTGPLLLLVQANIAPEQEEAFNAWYYHHVPRLLEIPGWLWGRRYLNVKGTTKYLALYGVEDMDAMARVMAADPALKDPRAVEERARFDAISGKTDVVSNVYEQVSGTHLGHPLLTRDHYLSLVMADCNDPAEEAAWNAWYDHSHVPNLTRVPGYLSGARFRVRHDPRFGDKPMGPKYLALYEWEGAHCLPALSDPDTMCAEAKAELAQWNAYGVKFAANMAWNVFRPIASHHRFAW
ncbi:MAG: hypothetical protein KDC18_13175 [Alphaproteobacteria bacterium]|nr:hypothetical protein [Alphaproteobacteria bacterium]MCB9929135.1 hypothetical protein [Alphaproteobacteria bacterium]